MAKPVIANRKARLAVWAGLQLVIAAIFFPPAYRLEKGTRPLAEIVVVYIVEFMITAIWCWSGDSHREQ